MAPMPVNIEAATPPIEHSHLLPKNRRDWPATDQDSYREVLEKLDAWCRAHDAPKSLNSWVAEEAVRRCS